MPGSRRRDHDASEGWWKLKKRPAELPAEGWDGGARSPRVLIECEDASMIWAMDRLLGDAGYEVAACVGPSVEATCSLAATGACDLQAGADVIVNALDSDARGHALASATRAAHPATPMVVTARAQDPIDDGASDDVVVLRERWTGSALVAAVDQLVDRLPAADPEPTA